MHVKWKMMLQLQYYRLLFLFGLKSEEIYYIGAAKRCHLP